MPSIPADVHGWTAVPRSIEQFLSSANKSDTKPYSISDIQVPHSSLAQKTLSYAKSQLSEPTFHHSMRVFHYGSALLHNHAPSNAQAGAKILETFFLACMLHDIGTVPANLKSTRMSFELWGAIYALSLLRNFGAPVDQAECVAEVVNRHQDLGEIGQVPLVLALIYFATIFGEYFRVLIKFALG
jgi:cyanamide hydratase